MSSKTLRTYLNDHLAGSVAALELLEQRAIQQHRRVEVQRLQTARVALTAES